MKPTRTFIATASSTAFPCVAATIASRNLASTSLDCIQSTMLGTMNNHTVSINTRRIQGQNMTIQTLSQPCTDISCSLAMR